VEFGAVAGLCAVFAGVVKVWLRPDLVGGGFVAFVLGIAPSFLFAFGVPPLSAAVFGNPLRTRDLPIFAAMLIVYEATELFDRRRTFDPWDMVAGLIAIALAFLYSTARAQSDGDG
jgi:hypothetical protein